MRTKEYRQGMFESMIFPFPVFFPFLCGILVSVPRSFFLNNNQKKHPIEKGTSYFHQISMTLGSKC